MCVAVHPRVCGEQIGSKSPNRLDAGSSPRVRGTDQWDWIPEVKGNYSGTLTPTNWKIFTNFINNLPIYKSFQQQVLKLLSHDTINIPVRGRNLVKSINALLLDHKVI